MPPRPATLVRYLRQLAAPADHAPESDAALLARFVRWRDEAAFAALVARHGPMILSVCRHVLRDAHDAEDCAQATFLVLARKAASLRRPQALAAWLHGVALRVARKARADARRRRGEALAAAPEPADPRPDPLDVLTARELLALLDGEIARLPEVYRLPVLLCCREGRTQEDAARLLGWTTGSVRGRLERGRKRLHARLARRGLTLAAAVGAAEAARGVASAAVPAALLIATAKAATLIAAGHTATGAASAKVAALVEGVTKAMTWTKIQAAAAALLAVGVLGLGAGLIAFAAPPDKRTSAADGASRPSPAGDAAPDAPADGLADWPAGAPLQVRPRFGDSRVGREEAERLARRYLGVDARAELGLTPAYLSDDDFPFVRPQKEAVWLAEAKDFRLPADPGAAADQGAKPAVLSRLYLALDADTGQLVEAFTAPRRPWWRETSLVGRPHEQFFRDTHRVLERPPDPPGCTVADALTGLAGEDEQGQLVVRYALYTNLGATRQVGNVLGAELSVPLALRRPALVTFREGVPGVKQSGPGEGTVGPVRCLLVRDAATGKPLDNESYGGEPPRPAGKEGAGDAKEPQGSKESSAAGADGSEPPVAPLSPPPDVQPFVDPNETRLAAGSHTVRVVFFAAPWPPGDRPVDEMRPLSRPIQIVIGDAKARAEAPDWGEPAQAVRVRLRADKTRWGADEAPSFHLDVWNESKTAVAGFRIAQGCLIQLDGAWYGDNSSPVACPASRLDPGDEVDGWLTFSLGHLLPYKGPDPTAGAKDGGRAGDGAAPVGPSEPEQTVPPPAPEGGRLPSYPGVKRGAE